MTRDELFERPLIAVAESCDERKLVTGKRA
jgi:hypothetical protein